MRVAIVCGGGEGVWDERAAALDMARSAGVEIVTVAVNAAGTEHPDPLHHWASIHPDHLYEPPRRWAEVRTENGLKSEYLRWSLSHGGNVDRVLKLWKGGSSGLHGLAVALEGVGCARAVLCGVPMDARPNAFTGQPWGDYQRFQPSWEQNVPHFRTRARSMSGWTRELLGEPTMEWLTWGDSPPELTDRQREVLELVGGRGLSYKRAARELGVTYWTVTRHATDIRDRAGLQMSPQRALVHLWHCFRIAA